MSRHPQTTGRKNTVDSALESQAHRPTVASSVHRADIQGLRAVLMIQVLLYHAWTVGSPIGVDAFILVSAYLMTSSFVRRSEAGRMPFFIERWGNTFKRLLPPLVVVVLATLGGTLLFLPATRWREITVQAFASLTYWENWRLAAVSADYYADNHGLSSPLQHLWSMSMQGQVFIIWPLVMTICVLMARKLQVNIRGTVIVAFSLVMGASLFWLLFLAPDSDSVYFDTRARIWEFAFGSMVAAAAPWLKIPPRYTLPVTIAAFSTLITYCLVSIGSYPGLMALVPMACVSALLLYTPVSRRNIVGNTLSVRPLVWLGGISYAVYLVHWPIFVIYLAHSEKNQLGIRSGVSLILISIFLAWILTKVVEEPLRKWPFANESTKHKYLVILISLMVGLLPVFALWMWINASGGNEKDLQQLVGTNDFPGAQALMEAEQKFEFSKPPIPTPFHDSNFSRWEENCWEDLFGDLTNVYEGKCWGHGNPEESEAKVLVAGSSHAQQLLLTQITPLLDAQKWSAYAVIRGNCPWSMPGEEIFDSRPNVIEDCRGINTELLQRIDYYNPDYAFLVVTMTKNNSQDEVLIPGVEELVRLLTGKGITVVGVRDNLRSATDLRECSDETDPTAPYGGCLLPESEHFPDTDPTLGLQEIPGFRLVEYRDLYCVNGVCPTIIGNIYTYHDSNHISTAYAKTMAPYFSDRVASALRLN